MSKRNQALLGIFLLVLWWFYLNIGLLFFIDLLRTDHWRSWFNETDDTYPTSRIIKPLVSGVFILYLWVKIGIEKTAIAWLSFAGVVLATLIYTLATPIKQAPSNKPTIVCDKNHENCHVQLPKPPS